MEIQETFIAEYQEFLEKAEQGISHLLFLDPVHMIHNTTKGRCWQERGRNNTLTLPSNTGRRRVNIIGAINACTKKFSGYMTEANCNRETIKVELDIIRNHYPNNKEIIIFLDNARYQKSAEVLEYAQSLNISLIFLPPYSPNLNLIERVWKLLKKKMRNVYREKFQEFFDALSDMCTKLDTEFFKEVSQLVNHEFQVLR